MLFGAAVWDPVLIIAQIVSVQCLWYLSLGLFHGIFLAPYIGRLSVEYLLDWRFTTFKHFSGWMMIVSNVVNSAAGAVYLVWVVERAKKCLDFGSTCYLIHLLVCWGYAGFPRNPAWWITNVLGLLIMSLFGEWLCVRREMQDIPLGALRGRAARAEDSSNGAPSTAANGSSSASAAATPAGPSPAIARLAKQGAATVSSATLGLRTAAATTGGAAMSSSTTIKMNAAGTASAGGGPGKLVTSIGGRAAPKLSALQLTPLANIAASLGNSPTDTPKTNEGSKGSKIVDERTRLLAGEDEV